MQAIIDATTTGACPGQVVLVVGPKAESPAIAAASEQGVQVLLANPKEDDYADSLVDGLRAAKVDLVCLAGFMSLLPEQVLRAFPRRVLNIHPALLPKFGGKGMYGHYVHEAVMAAGEQESGCTVHFVTPIYDEGEILVQMRCSVSAQDDSQSLAAKVLKLEHQAYPAAIAKLWAEVTSPPKDEASTPELRPINKRGVLYWIAYPIAFAFMALLFTILGPWRCRGRRNVPKKGGVLIISNHLSDCDPILVQLGALRPIDFMAKSELFTMPVLGPLIRWFKAFPVRRGNPDKAAMRYAVQLLQAGECVCIFPEGKLSETGELQAVLPGAALIVRLAGVPVVACGLQGTNRIIPYGKYTPRMAFSMVRVRFGQPRTFDDSASNDEILAWMKNELEQLTRR